MLKKIVSAATAAIICGGAAVHISPPAFAQAVKTYPYDVRPPVPGSGIDAFINRAADIGSTLIDGGTINNGSFGGVTPVSETRYPQTVTHHRRTSHRSSSEFTDGN